MKGRVTCKATGQSGTILKRAALWTKERPMYLVTWDDTDYQEVMAEDELSKVPEKGHEGT